MFFLSEHVSHVQLSITDSEVKWPLRFPFSYVQPVTQRCKLRIVLKAAVV